MMFWKRKYSLQEIDAMRQMIHEIAGWKSRFDPWMWYHRDKDDTKYEQWLRTYMSQGITLQDLIDERNLWKRNALEKEEKEKNASR